MGGMISAWLVLRPRRRRVCPACCLEIDGPSLRLFGSAEIGDPPYVIHVHPTRGCSGGDPVVVDALKQLLFRAMKKLTVVLEEDRPVAEAPRVRGGDRA